MNKPKINPITKLRAEVRELRKQLRQAERDGKATRRELNRLGNATSKAFGDVARTLDTIITAVAELQDACH